MKSFGDFFFGIADNSRSSMNKAKSVNIRKRGGKEEIDKERCPGIVEVCLARSQEGALKAYCETSGKTIETR